MESLYNQELVNMALMLYFRHHAYKILRYNAEKFSIEMSMPCFYTNTILYNYAVYLLFRILLQFIIKSKCI